MKIDPTGLVNTSAARRRKKASSAGSGGFAKHVDGDSAPVSTSVGGQAPIGTIDAVLTLQEVEDSTSEQANARAKVHAELLLDRLDEIRHGLLTGRIPKHTLTELARAVRAERAGVTNPRMAEVLDEIELRAEVELAKLNFEP